MTDMRSFELICIELGENPMTKINKTTDINEALNTLKILRKMAKQTQYYPPNVPMTIKKDHNRKKVFAQKLGDMLMTKIAQKWDTNVVDYHLRQMLVEEDNLSMNVVVVTSEGNVVPALFSC
jgi:membrane-anchored protein YejM (alkaline phosphatase superfamily)